MMRRFLPFRGNADGRNFRLRCPAVMSGNVLDCLKTLGYEAGEGMRQVSIPRDNLCTVEHVVA